MSSIVILTKNLKALSLKQGVLKKLTFIQTLS